MKFTSSQEKYLRKQNNLTLFVERFQRNDIFGLSRSEAIEALVRATDVEGFVTSSISRTRSSDVPIVDSGVPATSQPLSTEGSSAAGIVVPTVSKPSTAEEVALYTYRGKQLHVLAADEPLR